MYGKSDERNTSAAEYTIKTPTGDMIKIVTKKKVIEMLGCSLGFFVHKKYKGYELIQSRFINR